MQFSLRAPKPWLPTILAFIVVFICLLPILKSGLYSDDLEGFQARKGDAAFTGKTVVELTRHDAEIWLERGRIDPLALFQQEFICRVCKTVTAYKAMIFILNVLAVISFLVLLQTLNFRALLPLFLLFYAAGIQFRIQYQDAYTTFTGMYQFLCIYMFCGVTVFAMYTKSGKWYWLALAIFCYCAAMLVSEIGAALIGFLWIAGLIVGANLRKSIFSLWPFLLVLIIYGVCLFYARSHLSQAYSGTSPNFSWPAMGNILKIQLFASLPMSNLYEQAPVQQILTGQLNGAFIIGTVIFIIVLISYFIAGIWVSHYRPVNNPQLPGLFALALLFVPAVILMPSSKYQEQLHLGLGYLPVYVQNFGMALLLAAITQQVLSLGNVLARVTGTILVMGCWLATTSSFLFNCALIKVQNFDSALPAQVLYDNVEKNFLNNCESHSTIVMKNAFYCCDFRTYHNIFETATRKAFTVWYIDNWKPDSTDSGSKNCYLLSCEKGDTIFTRLYKLNCRTGLSEELLKEDAYITGIRLSDPEKTILQPR